MKTKAKKNKRRLLIQIALIMIPVFALMIIAAAWTIYISSVNSYLKAQEKGLRDIMNDTMSMMIMAEDKIPNDDTRQWLLGKYEETPYSGSLTLTDEENSTLWNYLSSQSPDDENEWYEGMPDDITLLYLKEELFSVSVRLEGTSLSGGFDSLILVSKDKKDRMRIIIDLDKERSECLNGNYSDLNISAHPVIEELLGGSSDGIQFEKTSDFPADGNCYMCYYPVKVRGEVRAVMGLAYKWDDLRSSVINTVINAIVMIAAGMVLLAVLVLVFLYRRAVKPVSEIQNTLIGYTEDKNSTMVVKEMYEIKADNELGYLADIISDLALEIDHYTKQNIRIAGERERAEKELYEAKVQIMVSQIRPHFMYNALSSIAILCKLDPETAYKATVTFSDYLRGNMDSLKQTAPVPFTKELEHLKKYLYIEKLRFDEQLNIVYDIQAEDFSVPQLSIQPIVENAVKHGVGMKEDGGTVTIATRETEEAFEVIISDDGVGFDTEAPKKDDGRSHVGMENTRRRLKDMCNADLIITSKPGEGTTARVVIPKDKKEE